MMDHLKSHMATRFSVGVKDSGTGDPGDPRELSFEIGRVGEPPTKYLLSNGGVKRSGLGQFHVDLVLKQSGQWGYVWRAFGATVTQAPEVRFIVDKTEFL